MNNLLKQNLIEWNKKYNNYRKLQHVYLATTVIMIFVAGLLSLLNNQAGQNILNLVKIAIGVFLINFFTMTITKSFIIDKIENLDKRSTKTNKK